MKTIRIKILFTVFLFSVAVPSVTLAMESEVLKIGNNLVESMCSNVDNFRNSSTIRKAVVDLTVTCVLCYFGGKFHEKMKSWLIDLQLKREVEEEEKRMEESEKKPYDYGEKFSDEVGIVKIKETEKRAYYAKKELLAKVRTRELTEDSYDRSYRLIFLNSKVVEKVRESLDLLKIKKYLVEKILILGEEREGYSGSEKFSRKASTVCMPINETHAIPFVITVDTEFLKESSSLAQEFVFDHEAGHVKADYEGLMGDDERNEVVADIYALNCFINVRKKKNQLLFLVFDRYINSIDFPYLSTHELIYHGEKLFNIQQKGNKLDVVTYARKIISDRKEDDYEQKITRRANKLLGLPIDHSGEYTVNINKHYFCSKSTINVS